MRIRKTVIILLIMLTAAAVILPADSGYYTYSRSQNPNSLEAIQNTNRRIAKEVLPAIVSIDVVNIIERQSNSNMFSSPFDFFFGRPDPNKDNDKEPEKQEFRSAMEDMDIVFGHGTGNKSVFKGIRLMKGNRGVDEFEDLEDFDEEEEI